MALIGTVWRNHKDWETRLWDDEAIEELGVTSAALKYEYRTWAAATNVVRLLILKKYGGIYLDCDCECLKPLDVLLEHSAVAAEQDEGRICNAVMGAEPNHPWICWQLAHFHEYDVRDAASGVYVATDAPREGLTIIPQHLVYPWMYDSRPETRVIHPESLLCHKWAGSWTK